MGREFRSVRHNGLTVFLAVGLAPIWCGNHVPAALMDLRVFQGMCDASAVEGLDETRFVVANDEDNRLRVYDWTRPGLPLREINLRPFLPADWGKAEMDLEGVARLGEDLYWISSHGRKAAGEPAPQRQGLLRIPRSWFLQGIPVRDRLPLCTRLLDGLLADARFAALGLEEAANRAPKAAGGLNIEALAAGPDRSLWIGFRNPVLQGRALMVRLLNPGDVVTGATPRFGSPVLLDLSGHGLRGAVEWGKGYLLIAGPTGDGETFRLYAWSGDPAAAPQLLHQYDFRGLNPEGITIWPGKNPPRLWMVSDDGNRQVEGQACKNAPMPQRSFRAWSIEAPSD